MQSKRQRTSGRLLGHGRTVCGFAAVLALAGLTATATVTSDAPITPTHVPTASPGGQAKTTARVTLLTGDTVGVDGDGRMAEVRPPPRRSSPRPGATASS